MWKLLIKLFAVLVVGLVGYNYFLGNKEEQEQSRRIVNQVKELGASSLALVISEKDKFDSGKFDEDIDRIGGLVDSLRSGTQDSELLDRLAELEKRKDELQERINADKALEAVSGDETAALNKELQELAGQLNKLIGTDKGGDNS